MNYEIKYQRRRKKVVEQSSGSSIRSRKQQNKTKPFPSDS